MVSMLSTSFIKSSPECAKECSPEIHNPYNTLLKQKTSYGATN